MYPDWTMDPILNEQEHDTLFPFCLGVILKGTQCFVLKYIDTGASVYSSSDRWRYIDVEIMM